jgi:hypothetical protein
MASPTFPAFPSRGTAARGDFQRYSSAFPDPFFDYASTQMPRNLYDVMRWCEYYWITNGLYRTACQRIVRYFLTKIELEDEDAGDDERRKYDEFLEKQMKIVDILANIGDDFMCYGNSYTSIHIPFRRYLRCPKCKNEYSLKWVSYKFQDWEFHANCPKCSYQGKFERVDRRSVEQDRIKVIRWSPHEIRLLYHPISHDTTYYWIPPADFKREIRRGNPFYIETTPWEIIEAVKKNEWFKFNPGVIYHVKEDTVAGIRNNGWGIPRIMANFKQAWYVQVLKRYNEAIGLDYIIPFRVITPGKGSGSGEVDPLLHTNLGQFLGRVMGMIQKHRRDPAQWNALPFPIDYQALGAEGKDLAPSELIVAGIDELLNSMGFPAELFKGSIEVQAAPMALRLFERTWTHLVSALNGWINWFFEQVTAVLNWEEISGRLQPVTLAEDMERKQILLQLASSQQVSKQTAYAPFGVDWPEEVRRMFEEEKYYQDQSKRFQKEQSEAQTMEETFETAEAQQQMQGAGMPGAMPGVMPGAEQGAAQGAMPAQGGAPMQAGAMPTGAPGGAGTTPDDMMAQAEQIAMQMLGMPYEARKSELLNLKKSDETLHALVIQKMKDIRQKGQQQGGFQAVQQMVGAQAG